MMEAVSQYFENLQREFNTGIAAEHAYRPALKALLESVDNHLNAVNDPKHIDAGAPDFIVLRERIPIAFVEAKDIGKDLARVEHDEQMLRYRKALPNLILTDYLEFRWYVSGEHRRTVRLGTLAHGKLHEDAAGVENVFALLRDFIREATPSVGSARELAERMADMAREIARLIEASLPDSNSLKAQMKAFEETLIPHLTPRQFADMYAQTLAYGLFAARVRYTGASVGFTLENAFFSVPETNPFLRRLFQNIAQDLDERVRWLVGTLAKLLAHADTDTILAGFGQKTRQEDPIVHFYETFLAVYDPAQRERRGVYYTPEPVVSYIVRSVDYVLKTRFNRFEGLADKDTLILDPATGTGTFLYFVIQQIYEALVVQGGQRGLWDSYVRDHLLPRLFGFELLMAPYAVAHMKLGIELQQTGYSFSGGQRLGIFLTNTLEEEVRAGQQAFAEFVAKEANEAATVKREKPIMVVMGNPPYSGHSANKGDWIGGLVRDYYQVDGKPLGERNPKWLQDDYVKFIRFGQWRIHTTGSGVLAFVTNHGYLDNPTFRGMRQQLMQEFDDIYLLNLHGNANKRETTPDGNADENVFDIRQGVAIGVFVKKPHPHPPAPSPLRKEGEKSTVRVHYADVWGKREAKYGWLLGHEVADTEWTEVQPQAPFYLFVPQNVDLKGEYEAGWKITDIFPVNVLGFQTHRDHFAVDFDRTALYQRIKEMRDNRLSDDEFRRQYEVTDNRDWKLATVRARLRQNEAWEKELITCLYRPFDWRPSYFSDIAMDYPRRELVNNVSHKDNLCLLTSRQQATVGYRHCWVAKDPANDCVISTTSREANQVFPLYLYPDPNDQRLFADEDDGWTGVGGRRPNLSQAFVAAMEAKLGMRFVAAPTGVARPPSDEKPSPLKGLEKRADQGESDAVVNTGDHIGDANTFTPEDVFHYAYAVFHSPTYRERYAEFLKIDFPRLPLTSDKALFRTLCEKGRELVELHLMRSPALAKLMTTFPVSGSNAVEAGQPRYTPPPDLGDDQPHPLTPSPLRREGEQSSGLKPTVSAEAQAGRVYINKTQYFEGVPPDVWEFHVGGYQVLEKWLKDRRGRTLSFEDLRHYQRIVVALHATRRLMEEIDEAIPEFPLV